MSRKTFTVQFNSDINRKFIFKNCPESLHVGCHSGFTAYKKTSEYTEIVHKDQTLYDVVSSRDDAVVFCFWFDDKTDVSIENCKSSLDTASAHYSRKEGFEGYHLANSDEDYYNFGIGTGKNDFIFDLTNATDTTSTEPTITISETLSNCTYVTTPSTPKVGEDFTISITANDGYYFKDTPTLTYVDSSGFDANVELTKNSDSNYSGSYSNIDSDGFEIGATEFTLKASAIVKEVVASDITITTTMENCTYTTTPTTPKVGDNFTIIITADDGYYFKDTPTLTYADSSGFDTNVILDKNSDTEFSGTFTKLDSNNPSNFTLVAKAVKIETTTYVTFTNETSNCTVVISPEKPTTKENFTVTISPEPNYTFTTKPKVTYVDSDGYEHELSYELNNETYTFTYTYIDTEISNFSIVANASVSTEISNKYGVITVYNPTQEEMKQISKVVFRLPVSGDVVDVSNYIIKYFKVFCNVESKGKSLVGFGKYTTAIKSNVINDDIVELECGNVQIVGKHKNTLDYENTDIEIFLPFVGIEKLDATKIMDKTIDLVYRCNILSGQCKALIFIDDIMIYEFDGDMSVQIPLQTSMENYDLLLQNNTNFMMGLIPYIVIRTNIEYSTTFINSNRVRDKIGKFKGFNTFDNFNLNSVICTDKEKELIADYLKEGIIL